MSLVIRKRHGKAISVLSAIIISTHTINVPTLYVYTCGTRYKSLTLLDRLHALVLREYE